VGKKMAAGAPDVAAMSERDGGSGAGGEALVGDEASGVACSLAHALEHGNAYGVHERTASHMSQISRANCVPESANTAQRARAHVHLTHPPTDVMEAKCRNDRQNVGPPPHPSGRTRSKDRPSADAICANHTPCKSGKNDARLCGLRILTGMLARRATRNGGAECLEGGKNRSIDRFSSVS